MRVHTAPDMPDQPKHRQASSKTLVLEGERAFSWNTMYSGIHWTKRKAEVDRVKLVVRAALTGDETPFERSVDIYTTAYYDEQPADSDNVWDKPYIDALKGWLLKDDNRRWVRWAASRADVDKTRPRVEIQITEVE